MIKLCRGMKYIALEKGKRTRYGSNTNPTFLQTLLLQAKLLSGFMVNGLLDSIRTTIWWESVNSLAPFDIAGISLIKGNIMYCLT